MKRFSVLALLAQLFFYTVVLPPTCLAQADMNAAEPESPEALTVQGERYANGHGVTQDVAQALMWYRKAAVKGGARAMNLIGRCYDEGCGVTQDLALAAEWYRKGAEAGSIDAMVNLASCYASGAGVEQSDAETFKWYDAAARGGDGASMYAVGRCYCFGIGVPRDATKGAEWYHKGAEAGDSDAMLAIACAYGIGSTSEKDEVKAFKWYRAAFDAGNMKASSFLHTCYYGGKGTEKNREEAERCLMAGVRAGDAEAMFCYSAQRCGENGDIVEPPKTDWLIKAAEAGSRKAMFMLGSNYANGIGVTKDEEESFKWYLKAAESGLPFAMWWVSKLYANGRGVSKSDEHAARWCIMAAEKGVADAMSCAGEVYYNGTGVRENREYAFKWFLKAAENGDERAMLTLATCYEKGEGVQKSTEEAFKWARKAADLGLVDAIGGVGLCYLEGQGVPQNDFLAYAWLSLAAAKGLNGTITANGLKGTITWRDQARMRLSPEMVHEAQQLALYWFENGTADRDNAQMPKKSVSDSTLPVGSGTGFFVTTDGYLLSAAHVVANANNARVLVSGKTLAAEIVQIDKSNDLALLKIDGTFTALSVKSSADVKLGSDVFTIGFPNIQLQGATPKLTKGVISGMCGIQDDPTRYQISVAVQPGNSGGPLVDSSGAVVGIVSARLNDIATVKQTGMLPQNVNYAVKSDYVFPLLAAVTKGSPRPRAASSKTFEAAASLVERAVCIVLVYQ